MAEAFDVRELLATLDTAPLPVDDRPKTINDLPKELLVSVFEAVDDLIWVRHTVPRVCKAWAELYRLQDASPLHETLEVNFGKELESALRERCARRGLGPRRPVVHASRIVAWTERRADWVRKLHLDGKYSGALKDFSSGDLGRLVAVVGSSLTELWIGPLPGTKYEMSFSELCQKPFWKSLRDSVVPHDRLRSLVVHGTESDVKPLGRLAGSLEELVLCVYGREGDGLRRFPESFCDLTELRRLDLFHHERITAIPAQISSLKKLELGKLKSLRDLDLCCCGLRAVPAFVGELESLKFLNLSWNNFQIDATTLDFLIKGYPRLCEVELHRRPEAAPWTPESRAHLEAFEAKLLAKNPDAEVLYE